MGKHVDALAALRQQRYISQHSYRTSMSLFGQGMDDAYKAWNDHRHESNINMLDRRIAQAEDLAQKERTAEMTQNVLANVTKELSQQGGNAAKAITAEIDKVFKGFKL